jgi:RNA polymerase Rpb1, domain 5
MISAMETSANVAPGATVGGVSGGAGTSSMGLSSSSSGGQTSSANRSGQKKTKTVVIDIDDLDDDDVSEDNGEVEEAEEDDYSSDSSSETSSSGSDSEDDVDSPPATHAVGSTSAVTAASASAAASSASRPSHSRFSMAAPGSALPTVDYVGKVIRGDSPRSDVYFTMQALKLSLPKVVVSGIKSVNRAVISKDEQDNSQFKLLVEGYDLLQVMGTPGVDASKTKSNHVIETASVLGIEASRSVIISELEKTYGSYGILIDKRHLMLLADIMTYRGEVLGITRFGIAKMKDSVLMLASFEKTPDHLFDAALHSRIDAIRGVSESIIVGTPIPIGTGLFKLLADIGSNKKEGNTSNQPQNSNKYIHSSISKTKQDMKTITQSLLLS